MDSSIRRGPEALLMTFFSAKCFRSVFGIELEQIRPFELRSKNAQIKKCQNALDRFLALNLNKSGLLSSDQKFFRSIRQEL